MHANLMHPSGFRKTTNHRMMPPTDFEAMLDLESREAFTARSMYHLSYPYRRRTKFTFTQN